MKKKFKIATLGCRTNQYESQAYADQLKKMGFSEAGEGEEAEVCIVNTCTVTESADSSSRHQIRLLAKQNPNSQVVVTGCLAERAPEEMDRIQGVSVVVPNQKKEHLLSFVFPDEPIPEFSIEHFSAHTRAFVKIQDGCNSYCTYCIIPYVRGRSRSRKMHDILEEIKKLVANGYKEVVLTGINIGDFDGAPEEMEKPVRLSELVRAVDQIEGIERIRISSIDPDEVDEDLADAVLNSNKTCPSMHIVLQSGSNVILKRMNRKYTRQIFLETVERLKGAHPDFTFTTDIIVGFPGETAEDFNETLQVMQEVKFAKVHMFPYSERKRTRAALYPNKVPQEIIQDRKQKVLRASEKTAFELREKYIGRKMKVLLETESSTSAGYLAGHTDNFLRVLIPSQGLRSNDLIDVELVANGPDALIGRRVSSCA
ncbi:MAG TPA: tRNA (N(6)-L-threonylcarbamoyladenosine(37)-C(2))-methylthiotransferase MtaB [Rhabdochlamydiaceae bacterium]|nr:tRNA (N(6)-L-threonylcarbamoyladenosine(37)-C(2))-methylthiotransferase MtaB [Rhabdochlamydiaceae bacterium]